MSQSMKKRELQALVGSESISLEKVSRAIGSFGDRSISRELLKDKEMMKMLDDIYTFIEQECIKGEKVVTFEELINAYTARGMNIAYLVGFRDCMDFKSEKIADID